jgi:Predicted transcriptional regulators
MKNTINFKRGSVELLVLYLLSKKDYYGYELSQTIKKESENVLDIPVGSLYPALYKLIDAGYISDHQQKAGKRKIRVYYHLEEAGAERLKLLIQDYRETSEAINKVLNYEPDTGEE